MAVAVVVVTATTAAGRDRPPEASGAAEAAEAAKPPSRIRAAEPTAAVTVAASSTKVGPSIRVVDTEVAGPSIKAIAGIVTGCIVAVEVSSTRIEAHIVHIVIASLIFIIKI
jgi:hypothetical protein